VLSGLEYRQQCAIWVEDNNEDGDGVLSGAQQQRNDKV